MNPFVGELLTLVSSLAVSTLTAGGIAATLIWLSKNYLSERIKGEIKHEYDSEIEILKARLKSDADVEVEKLKSQLAITAAERQVRFSRLHEKRGEVIAEVYAALTSFVITLADYTKAFEPTGGPSREDRRKAAVEAANSFAKLFNSKKIFIPHVTAIKLEKINQEMKQAFLEFAYGVDLMPDYNTSRWVGDYPQDRANFTNCDCRPRTRLQIASW